VVGQHRFQEQHLLRRWPGPVRVRVERQQRFRRKHLLRQSHEPTDALGADPSLAAPGTGGDGFDSLSGHQLGTNSPCRGGGVVVEDNGGRDFWGNPVPSDTAPDVGAPQGSAANATDPISLTH
jgi:hypothetical protein